MDDSYGIVFNPKQKQGNYSMNLGYACINMALAEQGITTNKGMIKRTFSEKGIQYACWKS